LERWRDLPFIAKLTAIGVVLTALGIFVAVLIALGVFSHSNSAPAVIVRSQNGRLLGSGYQPPSAPSTINNGGDLARYAESLEIWAAKPTIFSDSIATGFSDQFQSGEGTPESPPYPIS
jgi:hypothetical protein